MNSAPSPQPDPELLRKVAHWWNDQHLSVTVIAGRLGKEDDEDAVRALLRAAGCGARAHLPRVEPTAEEQDADRQRWDARIQATYEREMRKIENRERQEDDGQDGDRADDVLDDHNPDRIVKAEARARLFEELADRYGLTFDYGDCADGDQTSHMVDEVNYTVNENRPAPAVALDVFTGRFSYVLDRFLPTAEDDLLAMVAPMRSAAGRLTHGGPVVEAINRLGWHFQSMLSAFDDLEAACDLAGDDVAGWPEPHPWSQVPEHGRPAFYVSGFGCSGFSPVGVTDPLAAIAARLGVESLEVGDVVERSSVTSIEVTDITADIESAVVGYRTHATWHKPDAQPARDTLRTWRNTWDEHGRWSPV